MGQTRARRGPSSTGAGAPLWDPKFSLHLHGGSLAGMAFEIGDWSFPDSPPDVVWLAEVDGRVVGHVCDKAILNAVAAQERRGLPGWTPYERARQRWTGAVWAPVGLADPLPPLGEVRLAPPAADGTYTYAWAARMDPNLREPRHLQAVS